MPTGTISHVRQNIKAEELVIKLQKYVLAEPKQAKQMMTVSQVTAAKLLLGKVIPDLKALELTGAEGGPVVTALEVEFVDGNDEADDSTS